MSGTGLGTGTSRLQGSVIGQFVIVNKMAPSSQVSYMTNSGHQVSERFEGGVPDTLSTLVGVEKTAEPTTLATLTELKNVEPIEVNTVE